MINLLQNNFISKIKNIDEKKLSILSKNIVNNINDIHLEKNYQKKWLDEYEISINLSLFNHGLNRDNGVNDYILIDYINANKYIIKNRGMSRLIDSSSILNINIDDDLNTNIIKSDSFGDKIIDYLDLNIIAYYNRFFAKKLIDLFFDIDNNIRFYKLFSFYSAKYTIDLINYKNTLTKKDDIDLVQDIIDFIFYTYEDFSLNKPNW